MAYKARDRNDLLAGIDEFLDCVTVLPPGEWDPTIRIEPPKAVPSQVATAVWVYWWQRLGRELTKLSTPPLKIFFKQLKKHLTSFSYLLPLNCWTFGTTFNRVQLN